MHLFSDSEDDLPLAKFESMLKTNSVYFFDATEFEEIIIHYMNVGKMSLAKKALELGMRQHPGSVTLKLVHVEVLLYEEKIEKAEILLAELEEIEPLNEQIFLHKATLFSKKDKHKEAIEALRSALLYTDDQADILSLIGMEYLFLEDFETARFNFAKCIEVEFDDYSSLYNVIYCFDMEGLHQEAIDYLLAYIEKDPYSEIAWHQLGRQYYIEGQFEQALSAFDYSILIDEHFIGAYLEKAKTLEELGRYEEAIANFLHAVNLDDGSSFIYLRIGSCYEKLGNHKTALKYYNITVKEDPLLDKGWLALTNLYMSIDNHQKALYFINKALLIDDKNPIYWMRFAEINIKLNLFEEASVAYKKCIELEELSLGVFIALADVFNFLGEFQDAIHILAQAKMHFEECAEIEYRLGCLYCILNKENLGLAHLKTGLALDFDYHYLMKDVFPTVFEKESVQQLVLLS